MKELALNHLPELAPRTVESLNLLRLRLEQTAPDAKIILLTSTTPQEGKTTLALQFWQLLAGLGQRCLLVDGDLRHSGICRQCGLTGEHKVPGLAHYLSGSVPLEEVLYHTEIRGTCLVPASGTTSRPALLLEHPRFARMVESCENITVHREQVEHIDASAPILVATGPLTDGALADEIGALTGDERLHFYDAVAPIVTAESLDYNKVFAASRYDRGEADYLNCPFNKEEYENFHAALASAERAPLHDFDTGAEQSAQPDPDAHGKKADTVTVYEGCMPIEIMAARGADTMRFGPLRPVGLVNPNTGHRPWANVQLRAENKERTLYNIVGFQTNL